MEFVFDLQRFAMINWSKSGVYHYNYTGEPPKELNLNSDFDTVYSESYIDIDIDIDKEDNDYYIFMNIEKWEEGLSCSS